MTFPHARFIIAFFLFSQLIFTASVAPPSLSIKTNTAESAERAITDIRKENTARSTAQIDVDTIEDLRTLALNGIKLVNIRGYSMIGDGGGGLFRYEDGHRPGAYVENGGTVILPAGGNGSAAWLRIHTGAIDVRWFGARGDGMTDDTSAINKAVAFLRSHMNAAEASTDAALVFPPSRYVLAGSVNMTNIRQGPWHVMAQGAVFLGRGAGKVVFDLCRSRYCVWWGGHIIGDEISTPLVGMQIGRDVPAVVADDHSFYDLAVTGKFSRASFYNYASEGCYFSHIRLRNSDASLSSYCLIQDGNGMDFVPVSDYVGIGEKTGPASFNENVFIRPDIRKHKSGPAVYMSRTSRHTWTGAYVVTTNDAAFVVSSDGFGHLALNLDVHCEADNIQHAVRFAGAANQRIRGFRFVEHSSHARDSIFKADTSVSSLSLEDADIFIAGFHNTPVSVFSDKGKFRVRGSLSINNAGITGIDIAEFKGKISVPDRTAVVLPRGSYIVEDGRTGRGLLVKGADEFETPGSH